MKFPRAILAIVAALVLSGAAALACPPIELATTLAQDFDQAHAVLVGHVESDPWLAFDGKQKYWLTEIVIDQHLKSHPHLKGKRRIKVKRKMVKSQTKFLLFGDIYKNKKGQVSVDLFRGVEFSPKSSMVKYVLGAAALQKKSLEERLKYHFKFLSDAEFDVSIDAFREFSQVEYKNLKAVAAKLPADKIAGWLKDPRTSPSRYGLYATLLGHCGTEKDGKLLRTMVDDGLRKKKSEIEGILQGYLMLQPREAWKLIKKVMHDDKVDFLYRYACVKTLEFVRTQRPDLISRKDRCDAVAVALAQPDIADFLIDHLRHEKCWERAPKVIDLYEKNLPGKDYNNTYIKRAVLRYALDCPERGAAELVKEQRRLNPDFVNTMEELLKLENAP